MAKKYIILDAGHAKATSGKRSPDGKLMEWEFNNDMQYRLQKRLEALGFVVYLVNPNPEKGADVALATRCSRANTYWNNQGKPADCLYVSLHANAAGGSGWSTARGVEVYTTSEASSKSKAAAKLVNDQIYKDVYATDKGFKNRGHKYANFYVIKRPNLPAILIEYEFYSNKDGVNLLNTKRDLLCEATVKALCAHMKVTYKAPGAVQKPVANKPEVVKNVPSTVKPWKNGTYSVQAKVTASSLNVRAGRPGSAGYNTIVGKLKKGDIITVGYCLNGWFGITFNKQQAFISGDYVELLLK